MRVYSNRLATSRMVDELRKSLVEAQENDPKADYPDTFSAKWVRNRLPFIIDGDTCESPNLGIAIRMFEIDEQIREIGKDAHSDFMSELDAQSDRSNSTYRRFLLLQSPTGPSVKLLQVVGSLWRKYVNPTFGANDLEIFTRTFTGESAYDEFQGFLRSGRVPHWLDPAPTVSDYYQVGRDLRTNLVNETIKFLRGQDSSFHLLNIHSEESPGGLTAYVNQVYKSLEPDERAKCVYVSLNGNVAEKGLATYSFQAAVERIYRAMCNAESMDIDPAAEVRRMIRRIRSEMASGTPVFLVLDGVRITDTRSGMSQVLQDYHFVELLNQLMEPLFDLSGDGGTLDNFGKSKIIVLSDRKLTDVENFDYSDNEIRQEKLPKAPSLRAAERATRRSEGYRFTKTLEEDEETIELGPIPEPRSYQAECESEYALGIVIELIAQRLGKPSPTVQNDQVPGVDANLDLVALDLVQILKDHGEEQWAFALLIIATSPTGIRPITLRHVYHQWQEFGCAWERPRENFNSTTEDAFDQKLEELSFLFAPIVQTRQQELIYGIDTSGSAFEYPQPPMRYRADGQQLVTLDFRYPQLRKSILNAFYVHFGYHPIRSAHRILAESALRQQTVVFRHADRSSFGSLREYKLLLQTLYHGLLSLPTSSELDADNRLVDSSPYLAIPDDHVTAWTWLTQFLYRGLLENHNMWQVSRRFARDRLKRELLDLIVEPSRFREVGQHAGGSGLQLAALSAGRGTQKRSLVDQLTHELTLARAHVEYLTTEQGGGLELLRNTKTVAQKSVQLGVWKDLSQQDRIDAEKKALDFAVLNTNNQEVWQKAILLQLREFERGSSRGIVQEIQNEFIPKTKAALLSVLTSRNFESNLRPYFHNVRPNPETMTDKILKAWSPEIAGFAAEFLARAGEGYVVLADYNYSALRAENGGPFENPEEQVKDAIDGFLESFSYQILAEQLRRAAFFADPRNQRFQPSGHYARVYVRTALRLERMCRVYYLSSLTGEAGYFGRRARRMLDLLTRHLYHLPRERASIYVLEAVLTRMLSNTRDQSSYSHDLLLANQLLGRAEHYVFITEHDARVRFRYYLERHKNHWALATVFDDQDSQLYDDKKSQMFKERASHDYLKLEKLAAKHDKYPAWRNISIVEGEKYQRGDVDPSQSSSDAAQLS